MKYNLQKTTIWSFPNRGNWATHKGDYRGNWSPHIPRNLILKYSKEKDIVLDCFLGSGTTLIECKILNRNGIGIDINPKSIKIAEERLNFNCNTKTEQKLIHASAKDLYMIENSSIDFICTHPPYANIIKYSDDIIGDISLLPYQDFINELIQISKELYRVLKKGCFCSFMIGDIRKNKNVIPLGFMAMNTFINNGFTLKEIIIKEQHNCQSAAYWLNKNVDFYLLAHEYIFVLMK